MGARTARNQRRRWRPRCSAVRAHPGARRFSTKALRESSTPPRPVIAGGLPQPARRSAVVDILLARPPRTGAALPRTGDSAADITAALLALESSYVAVHGPPGTGKTTPPLG